MYLRPLYTSRKSYTRWSASSVISVRQGATNAHSSSLTSLGYALRGFTSIPQFYQLVHDTLLGPGIISGYLAQQFPPKHFATRDNICGVL